MKTLKDLGFREEVDDEHEFYVTEYTKREIASEFGICDSYTEIVFGSDCVTLHRLCDTGRIESFFMGKELLEALCNTAKERGLFEDTGS